MELRKARVGNWKPGTVNRELERAAVTGNQAYERVADECWASILMVSKSETGSRREMA
jgi:hypothetical protein